jgi:hypothetical protein
MLLNGPHNPARIAMRTKIKDANLYDFKKCPIKENKLLGN